MKRSAFRLLAVSTAFASLMAVPAPASAEVITRTYEFDLAVDLTFQTTFDLGDVGFVTIDARKGRVRVTAEVDAHS